MLATQKRSMQTFIGINNAENCFEIIKIHYIFINMIKRVYNKREKKNT